MIENEDMRGRNGHLIPGAFFHPGSPEHCTDPACLPPRSATRHWTVTRVWRVTADSAIQAMSMARGHPDEAHAVEDES